jgi:hypothetical protein
LLREAVSSEILAANSFTDKPFMSFAFIEFIIFYLLPKIDLNTLFSQNLECEGNDIYQTDKKINKKM